MEKSIFYAQGASIALEINEAWHKVLQIKIFFMGKFFLLLLCIAKVCRLHLKRERKKIEVALRRP